MAACGAKRRTLSAEPPQISWPESVRAPRVMAPGVLVLGGPKHTLGRDAQDPEILDICQAVEAQSDLPGFPLLAVVDDSRFATESWANFLWTVFTRSDPATDIYGLGAFTHCKHWGCRSSLIIDARLKTYHAPPLQEDPEVERRVDRLASRGGPLSGIID
jgi:4-hydroxy-3-polyprenylbenzoate decarboxylase